MTDVEREQALAMLWPRSDNLTVKTRRTLRQHVLFTLPDAELHRALTLRRLDAVRSEIRMCRRCAGKGTVMIEMPVSWQGTGGVTLYSLTGMSTSASTSMVAKNIVVMMPCHPCAGTGYELNLFAPKTEEET